VPSTTTYTWPAPTYTNGVTGGSAQAIGQTSISQTLTIPSGSGTATYVVTPVSGSCAGNTFTVIVVVNNICTPPGIQASAFTSAAITNTTMTIGWTRGNGTAGVLVLAKSGSVVNANPANGSTFTANAAFGSGNQLGSGNYVVYNGTGTSVNLTALTLGTTYYYAVYEYNAVGNCYNIPALTGNAATTSFGISENAGNLFNVKVFPNPFNEKTLIEYSLTENNDVELSILNISGQELYKVVSRKQLKGIQKFELDASKLSSGIYFYKLKIGGAEQKGKLIRY